MKFSFFIKPVPVAFCAHHGEGLPAARLPVSEHTHVVSIKGVHDHVLAEVIEYGLLVHEVRVLGIMGPVGVVKGEAVRFS